MCKDLNTIFTKKKMNSKSFEWFINLDRNKNKLWYSDFIIGNPVELSFEYCVNEAFDVPIIGETLNISAKTQDGKDVCFEYVIDVDTEMNNYDYYVSESIVHDGTLLFENKAICNVINKIVFLESFYSNLRLPNNGDKLHATVGNIILLNSFDGDWIPKDKPWCRERTAVFIPVKMEYE